MDLPKISESIAAKTTGESLNRHRMDVRVAAALSAVLNAPELRMLNLMCKVDAVMVVLVFVTPVQGTCEFSY